MSELQTIARLKIHPGKFDEFKRVAAKCMELVRTKDTGTLQYEMYINHDNTECLAFERYRDSQALLEHFGHAIVEVGDVSVERHGHDCDNLRHCVLLSRDGDCVQGSHGYYERASVVGDLSGA